MRLPSSTHATSRRFIPRRRPVTALATTAAATVLALGSASAPASASTYDWSVTCSEVTVDLSGYNVIVVQTVDVTADGKALGTTYTFRDEFHHTYAIPSHSEPVRIRLVVHPGSADGVPIDETKTSPVCGAESQSPVPSSSPSPSQSAASSAPGTAAPTASASAPAGAPSSDVPSAVPSPNSGGAQQVSASPLAETGASDSVPLIAGTAGAVALAGVALVAVARRRTAARR